jgi:plastocyanin
MRRICVTTLVAIVAAIASTARSYAANTLVGTDGPACTITMSKTPVRVGTYRITIHDRSTTHNLHLSGPGVNKATSVPAIGTTTRTVKLRKGIYRFVCDPNHTIMQGVLKVT